MILPDVNLALHAHRGSSPRHEPARRYWEQLLNSEIRVFLPWSVSLGFVRLVTNRRLFAGPVSASSACSIVESWFERPNVAPIDPGPRHREIVFGLLRELGTAGNLTTDAHLAAIAIEHGLEIQTTDADFARFPGLRWSNPLATTHAPRRAPRR